MTTPRGRARPGGRTERTRRAVQAAALELLAERGATGFGMEDLARLAGVHKTTIYRRWPTIAGLLADVASDVIGRDVAVPDTGTVEGDLRAFGRGIADVISHPVYGPALTALFTAPRAMRELDDVIHRFWATRHAHLEPVTERAIARGELPAGTRTDLLFESLGAPLHYRALMTRQPVDDAVVERAVRTTLLAARAGALC